MAEKRKVCKCGDFKEQHPKGGETFNFWGSIDSIRKRDLFADAQPTPEPSTFMMFGTALAGFGAIRLRRRRKTN